MDTFDASEFVDGKEGMFLGLPHRTYRAASGVNFSSLKHMYDSPKKYKWALENPKEPTEAMIFGTCVHAAILEPDTLPDLIVTRPTQWDSWRTDASKAWRDKQTSLVVTQETLDEVHAAAEQLKLNGWAAWILQEAHKEVAVFKRHERTGLLLKGRLDLPFTDKQGRTAVADIKKLASVKRELFSKAIGAGFYHGQLAYYLNLVGGEGDGWIMAVEEAEPHETRVARFNPASIQRGRALYESWLDKLAWCIKENKWPGVDDDEGAEVMEIEEPIWLQRAELPY